MEEEEEKQAAAIHCCVLWTFHKDTWKMCVIHLWRPYIN